MKNEIPDIELNYEELECIEANNQCVSKLLDKYLFILSMLSPTSIYNLIKTKIELLKKSLCNLNQVQQFNHNHLEYIIENLDHKFIDLHLR
jgi:hypothetical protein